mmetsp:Transcript_15460/g.48311  ORF Transcript_15460/g.48311 Transcript_15460/m.48311 type:complete len:289 (+) Transcript_15460:2496-3362(+)
MSTDVAQLPCPGTPGHATRTPARRQGIDAVLGGSPGAASHGASRLARSSPALSWAQPRTPGLATTRTRPSTSWATASSPAQSPRPTWQPRRRRPLQATRGRWRCRPCTARSGAAGRRSCPLPAGGSVGCWRGRRVPPSSTPADLAQTTYLSTAPTADPVESRGNSSSRPTWIAAGTVPPCARCRRPTAWGRLRPRRACSASGSQPPPGNPRTRLCRPSSTRRPGPLPPGTAWTPSGPRPPAAPAACPRPPAVRGKGDGPTLVPWTGRRPPSAQCGEPHRASPAGRPGT